MNSHVDVASQGKIKLVTVHGTGAGDATTTGDRWWQHGSKFLRDLSQRLDLDPAKIEVVPFQWELGPNSERGRRNGGKALYELLMRFDQEGYNYYVVGHSHGGSVIYNALLRSIAKRRPLGRLKSWCTVGTPFLDYRPNRFLFQRLGNLGLTIYITAIGALLFGATMVGVDLTYGLGQWLGGDGQAYAFVSFFFAFPYGLICLSLLYAYDRYSGDWHTPTRKKKVAQQYADRWIGLWHHDDEAISALSNVKYVSGPIIPSTFLVPFVGAMQLLLSTILTRLSPSSG